MFRAPQHPQLRGEGPQTLEGGRKGVGKISIGIKACNSWVRNRCFCNVRTADYASILFLSVSVISLRKVAIYTVLINSLES